MTPLYNKLSRFLPPTMTRIAVTVIYAALILMIAAFLIQEASFELLYLDLGR